MSSIFNKNYISTTYKNKPTDYPKLFCQHVFGKYPKGTKILDIGCGNGDFTKELINMGFDVYGIDAGIECEKILGKDRFKQVNLDKFVFNHDSLDSFEGATFDIVFSKSVIEHLENPENMLDNAHWLLKLGGKIITMTPSWKHSYKEQFFIDHTHIRPFTRVSLETIHELSDFKNINCDYFYQLPITWKHPSVLLLSKALQHFDIPYKPFEKTINWPENINKFIRFSKEVMLFCVAEK